MADEITEKGQPRPQGLLRDDFQNGGSSEEDPGKGWVTWYKISKNLGDFYHVTFQRSQNKMAAEVEFEFTLLLFDGLNFMQEAVIGSVEQNILFSSGVWK